MDIVAILSISFAGVVSIISTIQNSKHGKLTGGVWVHQLQN